jgi:hypothetical protein
MILLFGRNKGIHIHVIKRMVMLARCAKFKMQMMSGMSSVYKNYELKLYFLVPISMLFSYSYFHVNLTKP